MKYRATITDPHWRDEELQWARILGTGDDARGVVLLYLQKMCTAFHEFEPSVRGYAVDREQVAFFRNRLASRVRTLVRTMEANDLAKLDGFAALCLLLRRVQTAESVDALAELTEDVHALGHRLCDALEGRARA